MERKGVVSGQAARLKELLEGFLFVAILMLFILFITKIILGLYF